MKARCTWCRAASTTARAQTMSAVCCLSSLGARPTPAMHVASAPQRPSASCDIRSAIDEALSTQVVAEHRDAEGEPAAFGSVDETLCDEAADQTVGDVLVAAEAHPNGTHGGDLAINCDGGEKPPF